MEINEQFENKKDNLIIENDKTPLSLRQVLLFSLIIFNIILIIFLFLNVYKNDKIKINPRQLKNDIYLNNIKAYFDIKDINSPKKIINEPIDSLKIQLFIDGEKTEFDTYYQFQKTGEYLVEFKFNEELTDLTSLFMKIDNLKEIDFSEIKTNKVKSMDKLFQDCKSLEKANLNYLDTSQIKSMKSMFEGCSNLKEVLMKEFTTSNTIYTDSMFENCFNLTKIDIDYFDLTYTESAAYMFRACYQLKEVAFKNTNNKDSSSISFKSTFSCCYSLEYLNLDLFEKKSITKIDFMFNKCYKLKSIDLTKFETSQVTSISYLFCNCTSLKSIDIIHLDLTNVIDMSYVFSFCSSLESIDLSNFDTSKARTIGGLFFKCSSLKSIELNRYPINITSINDLFNGCTSLSHVKLRVDRAASVDRVFNNCNSLKYLDLSEFNGKGIQLYVNDFFPKDVINAIIIYDSNIIGNLERRIPSTWEKIDVSIN